MLSRPMIMVSFLASPLVSTLGFFADIDLHIEADRPPLTLDLVGQHSGQLFAVQPVEAEIFAHRRHEGTVHPFKLQAKHHHEIAARYALAHIVEHLDAPAIDAGWHQGRWSNQPNPCAKGLEHGHV